MRCITDLLILTVCNHVQVNIPKSYFAVSYAFFGAWTPFLQHAAIGAVMAALRPLDSLAHVGMVDVAWVLFVPRPSYMSTALSTERCNRPRATVVDQDLIVAPLEQTAARHTPVRFLED